MKRISTFCLAVAAILILALIWYREVPPHMAAGGGGDGKPVRRASRQPLPDTHESRKTTADASATRFRLGKVEHVPDYAAIERSYEKVPFAFKGGGTSGRVVDHRGNVLMESGDEIGIYGFSSSPDNKHVLIKGGSAVNFVMDPATLEKIQLPIKPAGADMLAFGSWYWIDDRTLVGESGVEKISRNGKSSDDDNVFESKLYIYDIVSRRLKEVDLAGQFEARVFGIVESHRDGYVSLVERATNDDEERETGWFRISAE